MPDLHKSVVFWKGLCVIVVTTFIASFLLLLFTQDSARFLATKASCILTFSRYFSSALFVSSQHLRRHVFLSNTFLGSHGNQILILLAFISCAISDDLPSVLLKQHPKLLLFTSKSKCWHLS